MTSLADQVQTLGLMAAHESAIADLYHAYAEQFPDRRDFFQALANQEIAHARCIAGFAKEVEAARVLVNPGRFTSQSITTSLDFVEAQVRKAANPDLSLLDALATALDIEEALIERQYFRILEGDSASLKQLLQSLAAETSAHREQVRHAWEQERAKSTA